MENTTFPILDTIEKIGTLLKDREDKDISAYEMEGELKEHVEAISEAMELSYLGALHFAALFFISIDDDSVYLKDIARFMHLRLRDYSVMNEEMEKLIDIGFVLQDDTYSNRRTYNIQQEIRDEVLNNKVPQKANLETDIFGIAKLIGNCFEKLESRAYKHPQAMAYLHKLKEINSELPVMKLVRDLELSDAAFLITMGLYCRIVSGSHVHDVESIIRSCSNYGREFVDLKRQFLNGQFTLLTHGLIEWDGDDIQSREEVVLTEKGVKSFFGDEAEMFTDSVDVKKQISVIEPDTIAGKNLFYNRIEHQEMSRLESILTQDRYEEVCNRLKGQNMSPGICVLFYGGPGTGKTESVLQLAKKTGRAIRQVDISSIKDKWVGESEKKAKGIFDQYRKLCKSMSKAPILLLNEADAIITKRINVERSVDQMSNTMQNIFLEEMEKFEGILIATTNLQHNLDPAFDRRFLYKIKFEKPSVEVRAQLLLERIPGLSATAVHRLAMEYELSGGQIENVARKVVTEIVLNGKEPSEEALKRFLLDETGYRSNGLARGHIGFSLHAMGK